MADAFCGDRYPDQHATMHSIAWICPQSSCNLFVIIRRSWWNNHTPRTYANVCVHTYQNNYHHKRFWGRYNMDTVSVQRASNGNVLNKSTDHVKHGRHQSTHAEIIAMQYNFLLVCSKMINAFSAAIFYLCRTVYIHKIDIVIIELRKQVHGTASAESCTNATLTAAPKWNYS